VKRCNVTEAELGDLLDRQLSPDDARRIERHLEECAACRDGFQSLIGLRNLVHGLAKSIEPDRDLWPGIAARLFGSGEGQSGKKRRTHWAWIVISAAAAAILVAVSVEWFHRSSSTELPSRAGVASVTPANDSLRSEVAKAEEAYVYAAGQFLAQLESPDASLPADTKDVLQGNLVIADRAISEVKSAWERQPHDVELARKLLAAHERRVELLQQVAHFSFGNQSGG